MVLLYLIVVKGAKMTTMTRLRPKSSQKFEWIAPLLSKSRSAVTKWLTGLRLTKACKNFGKVLTGIKAFERKVRSIITVMEMPVIAAELVITCPIKAKIQLIDQLKTMAGCCTAVCVVSGAASTCSDRQTSSTCLCADLWAWNQNLQSDALRIRDQTYHQCRTLLLGVCGKRYTTWCRCQWIGS